MEATLKQLSFIEKLLSERPSWASSAKVVVDGLTTKAASSLISTLLNVPPENRLRQGDGLPLEQISEGSYWTTDGGIARVQPSKTSGRLYALKLNADLPSPRFEYVKGTIYRLKRRMTLEEAKAWGARVGVCCVCALRLTDEKSIEAGIGPVCAKKFGGLRNGYRN